nr:PREDICTED: myotubularin-related protein 3 isoform X2 [Bemisia tabaci]
MRNYILPFTHYLGTPRSFAFSFKFDAFPRHDVFQDSGYFMDDCDGPASLQSIFHVRAAELYPKRILEAEKDLSVPFSPLCGEAVEFLGRTGDGILALSNYRIYHLPDDGSNHSNIPLGLVEQVEVRDLFYLQISCKDARTYRCFFTTNEHCMEWFRRLAKAVSPPKSTEELFAFAFYAWASEEGCNDLNGRLGRDLSVPGSHFRNEVDRLKFEVDTGVWRISNVNSEYGLCPTYPRYLIVPKCITDAKLEVAAKFRSARRVPAVVWRHKGSGAVIARCSQPEVGWLGWRSEEDETLLKAITQACAQTMIGLNKNAKPKKLLIVDARSYTTAVANRARGGGCECPEYYPNCEIQFMNLANIHSIRKSFHALRQLCATSSDVPNWFSLLESTRWLANMSGLLHAAVTVTSAIEKSGRPVLVHCSDGWDRTPQIVSLAELLLDPYYRTIEGFQVLVEREWLEFGHKFADRCGQGDDQNDRCPVFLQWLDCLHNLLLQFPCAFEFSKSYLVKLAQHSYSNLFGTFLCNSNMERTNLGIQQRTFSVWKFLQSPQFRNILYWPNQDQVLYPSYHLRDLQLWRDLYLGTDINENNGLSEPNRLPNGSESIFVDGEEQNGTGDELTADGDNQREGQSDSPILNGFSEPLIYSTLQDDPSSEELAAAAESDLRENNSETMANREEKETELALSELVENSSDSADKLEINVVNGNSGNIKNCVVDQGSIVNEIAALIVEEQPDDASKSESDDYCKNTCDSDIIDNIASAVRTLNLNCDSSVDSSTETLVPATLHPCRYEPTVTEPNLENGVSPPVNDTINSDPINSDICRGCSSNGSRKISSISSPISPASGRVLDSIDGLPPLRDDVQSRLEQIMHEYNANKLALERELHSTRVTLLQQMCHQCTHINNNNGAEKPDDEGSVCSTDVSWEAVEEREAQPVLWVPDHAVTRCMGCDSQFWLGRRKHHCSCGKIFCADCSENVVALPNEQLYEPVRVCETCYNNPVSYKNTINLQQQPLSTDKLAEVTQVSHQVEVLPYLQIPT